MGSECTWCQGESELLFSRFVISVTYYITFDLQNFSYFAGHTFPHWERLQNRYTVAVKGVFTNLHFCAPSLHPVEHMHYEASVRPSSGPVTKMQTSRAGQGAPSLHSAEQSSGTCSWLLAIQWIGWPQTLDAITIQSVASLDHLIAISVR